MALVELLEGVHVALSGPLSQCVIRLLLCLGFGCGHVFVCSGKRRRNITSSCLFATTITAPPISRERYPSPQDFPSAGLVRGEQVPSNAGVMRRCERVVALPDP